MIKKRGRGRTGKDASSESGVLARTNLDVRNKHNVDEPGNGTVEGRPRYGPGLFRDVQNPLQPSGSVLSNAQGGA